MAPCMLHRTAPQSPRPPHAPTPRTCRHSTRSCRRSRRPRGRCPGREGLSAARRLPAAPPQRARARRATAAARRRARTSRAPWSRTRLASPRRRARRTAPGALPAVCRWPPKGRPRTGTTPGTTACRRPGRRAPGNPRGRWSGRR
eukprot:14938461-Alexandrium_andersonii.AAC.1